MDWRLAVVWTCLLGAGLAQVLPPASTVTTSKASPQPPKLIDCVFLNRANITCRWEAGDTPVTHYTLKVQKKSGAEPLTANSSLRTFTCTTSATSCTADINFSSVRFQFCITITAHGRSGNISSDPRCRRGRDEVMLPAAALDSVKPANGTPQCLNVTWSRIVSEFPMSDSEIMSSILNSQIAITSQDQPDVQVKNVTVKDKSLCPYRRHCYNFLICLFRPDTSYTIRIRHRYQGPESPWSLWSNPRQGRTAEDAPSAAPAFWKQVEQTEKNGSRLVSLLWKPLPRFLAKGRVRFYNVTCQTRSARILDDHGSCRDLQHTSLSCTLLLPAERCSCALTASNSAGTSPEAQIWLLGASDKEPPAPRQLTPSRLDDDKLNLTWTAPADPSVSGFVVEWFAVRDLNASIRHWEILNSSCRTLVITEGVKPMERYAVSVRTLYGKRGAGKNRTLHTYTREGAPSDGPTVEVQQISGSKLELSWGPVPVELLRGFLRNYTLYYGATNQAARSVFVPGHVHRYSLENLSPGNYDIFMKANTDAGPGAAGPTTNVHIDSEEISIAIYAVLPLMLTLLGLTLMACLTQIKLVKEKLCEFVPDPSSSSLAHWTPETLMESMKKLSVPEEPEIKYSKVVLLSESERQNSDPDQATTYQSHSKLQTYSSQKYSPLTVSGSQTPQNTRISEKKFNGSSLRAKTTSDPDLSYCSSIYSSVVFSQALKSPPAPFLSPFHHQFNGWQRSAVTVSGVKPQLGGDSEPPEGRKAGAPQEGGSAPRSDSPLSPSDDLKTFRLFLKQHQSPVSFPAINSISQSSVLLSHPAEVTSPTHIFPQSHFNSVPSLQPDTFTHPTAPSDDFPAFLPTIFVDLTYCPVERDPYISSV